MPLPFPAEPRVHAHTMPLDARGRGSDALSPRNAPLTTQRGSEQSPLDDQDLASIMHTTSATPSLGPGSWAGIFLAVILSATAVVAAWLFVRSRRKQGKCAWGMHARLTRARQMLLTQRERTGSKVDVEVGPSLVLTATLIIRLARMI